jgi:hypothetical protein
MNADQAIAPCAWMKSVEIPAGITSSLRHERKALLRTQTVHEKLRKNT